MRRIFSLGLVCLVLVGVKFSFAADSAGEPSTSATGDVQPEAKIEKRMSAQFPKFEFGITGQIRRNTGYTDYHINFTGIIYVWDGSGWIPWAVPGHSVLAFPIDGYRAEATVNGKYLFAKNKAVVFDLGVSTVLTQPKEAMVDSDYVDLYEIGMTRWVLGATRSRVDYSSFDIEFKAGYPMMLGKKLWFVPCLGFQKSINKFDVMGLAGWYEWSYGDKEAVDSAYYAGTNVMDYEITYNKIITGAVLETVEGEAVILSLKAHYYPWVGASDYDNHLLRGKEATTDATGTGYLLEGKVKIPVYTTKLGSKISIGGGYAIQRITVDGKQQQSFYSDDPSTPEVETDYIFEPIDNKIRLRQNNANLFIEYKL